ncbi:hypothetical protein Tco_0943291 [Tanacetum coccineum]
MLDYGFNFVNTKIYIDNESTICIVKNPVYHSKTKHIAIRHHFIRDAYEKKLIHVLKIHTDDNVADLLTKAFNVSSNQMSSATSRYLHFRLQTPDSEPDRAFWGADEMRADILKRGIPRVIVLGYDCGTHRCSLSPTITGLYKPDVGGHKDPQTLPVPQDEDEREPMFDEDDEDEEEEEYLAPADSAIVVPVDEPVFPPEGTEPVIPPPHSTTSLLGLEITFPASDFHNPFHQRQGLEDFWP